jgi:hypothetical protein
LLPRERPAKANISDMTDASRDNAAGPEPSTGAAVNEFEANVAAAWPPTDWRDVPVVVAVSGGADSVALVRVLARLRLPEARLYVAHFNHRLR